MASNSQSIGNLNAKVTADASQFISEFKRADNESRRSSAAIDKEVDRLVKGVKRKFGAADIGKDVLKGLGIGSGFALAQQAADLIVGHFRTAAEDATSITEETQKQLDITRQLIALRQDDWHKLDAITKRQRDAQNDLNAARARAGVEMATDTLATGGGLFGFNPMAAIDSLLRWTGTVKSAVPEVAKLTTQVAQLNLELKKGQIAAAEAADNESFKETLKTIEHGQKVAEGWRKSQVLQADEADAFAKKASEADAAMEAHLDALADKWVVAGGSVTQYARDLAEIIKLQESGKLSGTEAEAAMTALMKNSNMIDPAGTARGPIEQVGAQLSQSEKDLRDWKQSVGDIAESASDEISYALIDSLKGVEGAWSRLGDMIVSEIARIIIQLTIVAPLVRFIGASLLGGVVGGTGVADRMASYGTGKASGGGVDAGFTYRVNENGQEFFKPDVGGTIIPVGSRGAYEGGKSGGGTSYVFAPQIAAGVTRQDLAAMMPKMFEQFSAYVAGRAERGGRYRNSFAAA